jgi:DNA-binding NarL/FixJ family response regulator
VLLDWELPGLQAVDLLPALHVLRRPPKVVVFSERREARREALTAGADAFVSQDDPPEGVLATVRAANRLVPYLVVRC